MLYCPIRKEVVAHLPEEAVRQNLLEKMVYQGNFPSELLVVEKSLKELLPAGGKYPKRRVDILSFFKKQDALLPLLLIECKSVKLNAKAERQLVGYNYYLKAPFIALANVNEFRLGRYCFKKKEWFFENREAISYVDLIQKI